MRKKEVIFTEKATVPTAWYSQAIKTGGMVFLAGVCGDDPKTGELVRGDFTRETMLALENLKNTVEAAGGTMRDIVKVNVYVTNIGMMKEFNEVYRQYFPENPPARIAMEISALSDGANLELDAVAVLDQQ
ncbi:MAG: Rid family detoxifying hydrolase [Spirochaetaceae bacterium]|jgi:2-iminobutanoate/2-iminopropanoate deaminase|nr:Rid family detoxifying hydrolase [Spirochaetaceae bacterium]